MSVPHVQKRHHRVYDVTMGVNDIIIGVCDDAHSVSTDPILLGVLDDCSASTYSIFMEIGFLAS